jgi:hypothetical protein
MTSIQIQKNLERKVTEKMLDYELHRFCTMTVPQLKTRIKKIKSPVKLEAFRTMAKWCDETRLVILARSRRNELYI